MADNLQTKTTKLINYAKSQLSSKGVTSTATTLRGVLDNVSAINTGSDGDYDITVANNDDGSQSLAIVDAESEGIIPTGTINITENGVTDVTNYASANVNVTTSSTGLPLNASSMPTPSADNLGKIYKYTGATNDNYTNGELYIVEEVS